MSLVNQGINDVSNLKDILLTYNKITEACFQRCTSNFNSRELTELEKSCVDGCCHKHINGNQRMMSSFMQIQSAKQQQMIKDVEKQQKELMEQQQQAAQDPMATSAPLAEDQQTNNSVLSDQHANTDT